ncbi:MAG: hypothetical protein AAGI23_13040 [Bacteroidota bacterium]
MANSKVLLQSIFISAILAVIGCYEGFESRRPTWIDDTSYFEKPKNVKR